MLSHVRVLGARVRARRYTRPTRLLLALYITALVLAGLDTRPALAAATIQQVELTQALITEVTVPAAIGIVPGQPARVRVTVRNTSSDPIQLVMIQGYSWGIVQTGTAAKSPALPTSKLLTETLRLAPSATQIFSRTLPPVEPSQLELENTLISSYILYCLANPPVRNCPDPATNPTVAAWHELPIPLLTNDLGDAPDSTNHFGVAMHAYPTVPAQFPTVFDPAVGAVQGPLHRTPRPFHLGQRVSVEVEADIGPDQDPLNNIVPPADNPDNDRFDDGIRPGTLSFQHCQRSQVPVKIFIDPAFQALLLQQGQTTAYLNVWLDGLRDGDWDDIVACPNPDGQQLPTPEHIVIDQPVNIAALGAGTTVFTITTGRVPWPDALKEKPAWLRISLSETLSNKTLGGGTYGDGRGYANPFRLGETEDYLINRGGAGGPDVEVRKVGRLEQIDPTNLSDGQVAWLIEYHNRGDQTAREVVLRDQINEPQGIIAILIGLLTQPELPRREENGALVFAIGDLEPGASGRIIIRTRIPAGDPPLTLRNQVQITATNDINLNNNQAIAELQIGGKPPVLDTTNIISNALSGQVGAGARVRLLVRTENGLVVWPNAGAGQQNPQTTGSDGIYRFSVPAGTYVVEAQKDGYEPYRTEDLVVVDTPVRHDIQLTPISTQPHSHTVTLDEAGFDPPVLLVKPGENVKVINLDIWEHAVVSPRDPASGQATGKIVQSGTLAAGESFTIPALDASNKDAGFTRLSTSQPVSLTLVDSLNGFNRLTIMLDPEVQATPQPTPQPTAQPTARPDSPPTTQPTTQPTAQPTAQTGQPTTQPTTQPTAQPTAQPAPQPTSQTERNRTMRVPLVLR